MRKDCFGFDLEQTGSFTPFHQLALDVVVREHKFDLHGRVAGQQQFLNGRRGVGRHFVQGLVDQPESGFAKTIIDSVLIKHGLRTFVYRTY